MLILYYSIKMWMRHRQSAPLQMKASPLIMVKCQNPYVCNYLLKIFKECLVAVQILQKNIFFLFEHLNYRLLEDVFTFNFQNTQIKDTAGYLWLYGHWTWTRLSLSVTYNLPDLLLWLRFLNREIVWMQEAIRLRYHWSSLHCARLDYSLQEQGLFIQFVRTEIFMLISDPACD